MAKTIKIHDPNNGATNLFAKLLATENISVRHDANAPTAMFDVKGRTLTLPVWHASKTLYDMLVGHEVAHALFTPAVETEQQFMDDLRRVHSNVNVAKQYINVVEDARIERRIKGKFPGLRNDFRTGYVEMRDKDFFGLGDDDPSTLSLIDRLNIQFKLGIHTGMEVEFSADEQQFVTRMENTDTWDDVLTLSHDLAKWSEEHDEKQQQQAQQDEDSDAQAPAGEGDESGEASTNFGGDEDDDNQEGSSPSPSAPGEEDGDDEDGDGPANQNGDPGEDLTGPAESMTQQAHDHAMDQMRVDGKYRANGPERYLTVGKIIKDNIVVSIDEIDNYLAESIAGSPANYAHYVNEQENAEFLRTARQVVGNMVKQFEMKKAADLNKRVSIARTGVIDVMRLTRYKFDDDLFLRNTIVPNGKNHGMIMLVDWSSSMNSVIKDTLRQVVVLSMFCKKLNIPFDVYAFSSQAHPFKAYEPGDNYYSREMVEGFALTEDFDELEHVAIRDFCLLHLLSSTSKKNNWMKSITNVLTLSQWRPMLLGLGSTPLDDALLVMPQIIEDFQRTNKAQVMNMIVLTDGQTTGSPLRGNTTLVAKNGIHCKPGNSRWDSTPACLRYVHNETGCNMLGLFVCEAQTRSMHSIPWNERETAVKALKADNYFQNPVDGYHAHFLVRDSEIKTHDIFAGLNEDASPTKIRNTFIKQLGDRKKAFSYTGRFVDMICAIQGGL
jgi:hypothetical protein